MDNKLIVNRIAKNAIVLALYVVLTFVSFPIAFSGIQFRLSELLILLVFFNPDYAIGVTLGCFLCNLASPFMPWDLLIGTGATFLSCLCFIFCPFLFVGCLFSIAANSFLVAIEYAMILNEPYFLSTGLIAIGETTMVVISYILCMIIMKKEKVQQVVGARIHLNFKF